MKLGCKSVEIIPVVKTTATRGNGTALDCFRLVTQYWDFDGNLIGEHDCVSDSDTQPANAKADGAAGDTKETKL